MRFALPALTLASLVACTPPPAQAPVRPPLRANVASTSPVTISLAHSSAPEAATRRQLLRLAHKHDLRPWLFTHEIAVDETSIPHSHPVLTLHTRHLRDDDQLLSTFIHEEIHWFLDAHEAATAAAVTDLRARFPSVPVGFPDGAKSERSSYEHLLVILLEYDGLARCVGRARAEATFDFWQGDHYRGLYALVRKDKRVIEAIATKHGLFPLRA